MGISSVLLHLKDHAETIREEIARDERFSLVGEKGEKFALTIETDSAEADRQAYRYLQSLHGVVTVIPVFMGYDADTDNETVAEERSHEVRL